MQAMLSGDQRFSMMEQRVAKGEYLAEKKYQRYVEGLDGVDKSFTALALENTADWLASIDETVRAVNVGNFDQLVA